MEPKTLCYWGFVLKTSKFSPAAFQNPIQIYVHHKLDKSLQGRDARTAGIVTSGMYGSGSSKPKGAAHSCPSLLINVSPDSGLRQIVRRGHGGQYQDGSERFCFFISLTKKSVKTGSPNRLSLSLNLTFRGFCENRVFKVSIASSTCPGFIYQWQK